MKKRAIFFALALFFATTFVYSTVFANLFSTESTTSMVACEGN